MIIYTDGGTRNTGTYRGGHVKSTDLCAYAYLIVDPAKHHALAGAQAMTGFTNNQMEGTALNMAFFRIENVVLQAMHRKSVQGLNIKAPFEVVADSKYVIGQSDDLEHLKWRLQNKKKMPNKDVWRTYLKHREHFPNITFQWVKGHANTKGNIYVDHLLNKMMDRKAAGKTPYCELTK